MQTPDNLSEDEFYDALEKSPVKRTTPPPLTLLPSVNNPASRFRQEAGAGTKSSPGGLKQDSVLSTRYKKLAALRERMLEEAEDAEFQLASAALGPTSPTSEQSDQTSLASWGKRFLANTTAQAVCELPKNGPGGRDMADGHAEVPAVAEIRVSVVRPSDSISTKGASISPCYTEQVPPLLNLPSCSEQETTAPDALLSSCASHKPSPVSTASTCTPPNSSRGPPPPFKEDLRLCKSSAASSSTNSSKSNTLDNNDVTAASASSLGGSVASRMMRSTSDFGASSGRLPGSGRSSKSNSLTRDAEFIWDEEELARIERRNSEAAEIVDAITSELVPEFRDLVSTPEVRLPKVPEEPLIDGIPAPLDPASQISSRPSAGSLPYHQEIQTVEKSHSLPTSSRSLGHRSGSGSPPQHGSLISNGHSQPDIVLSNTVPAFYVDSANPIAPPRRRKKQNVEPQSIPVWQPPSQKATSPSPASATLSAPPGLRKHSIGNASLKSGDSAAVQRSGSEEVLENVIVKNLDTGEQLPLSLADSKIPVGINPLSLHILRITSAAENKFSDSADSDAESLSSVETADGSKTKEYLMTARLKTQKYRRIFGRKVEKTVQKTVSRISKIKAQHAKPREEGLSADESDMASEGRTVMVRASSHHKGPYDFDQLRLVQDLSGEHAGAVWCVKFSFCGRLLATAGQDNHIRIWVLKDAYDYFNDMRLKYNAEAAAKRGFDVPFETLYANRPTHSSSEESAGEDSYEASRASSPEFSSEAENDAWAPFCPKPFCYYRGHNADVLDVAWSKNYFMLSSSMDRTVRLWHISRMECLCCFQHMDFVTAIAFLPRDDRYFLSGSLDGKLRLWNIPEKKVALWNEITGTSSLITALTFVKNGAFAAVGTFDGRCVFYSTEQLKYFTQLYIKPASRGKAAKGTKVTGLEATADKLLVTTNDSRVRLYDLREFSLTCKYKGCTNYSSQIKASFSPTGKHIVCGSEDKQIYIWRTFLDHLSMSVRKDRNRMWECIRAHNAVVTAAIFAPKPEHIIKQIDRLRNAKIPDTPAADSASLASFQSTATSMTASSSLRRMDSSRSGKANNLGDVLVSADFSGTILICLNKATVKTGGSIFLASYN